MPKKRRKLGSFYQCARCGEFKRRGAFHHVESMTDSVSSWCRDCTESYYEQRGYHWYRQFYAREDVVIPEPLWSELLA